MTRLVPYLAGLVEGIRVNDRLGHAVIDKGDRLGLDVRQEVALAPRVPRRPGPVLSLASLAVIAATAVLATVIPLASPLLLAAPLALPTPVLVVAAGLLVAAAATVVIVAVVSGPPPGGPVRLPILVPAVPACGGPLALARAPAGAFPFGFPLWLVVGLAGVVLVGLGGVILLGRLPGRQHRFAEGQVVAGDVARHLVEGPAESHLRRKPVRRGIPVIDDSVELVRPQPGLADPPIDVRDDGLFRAELDEYPRPFDRREAVPRRTRCPWAPSGDPPRRRGRRRRA